MKGFKTKIPDLVRELPNCGLFERAKCHLNELPHASTLNQLLNSNPLFYNINVENCFFVFLLLTKQHSLPVDQECTIVDFGTKINISQSIYYLLSKNKPFPVCFRLISGQFTGLKC